MTIIVGLFMVVAPFEGRDLETAGCCVSALLWQSCGKDCPFTRNAAEWIAAPPDDHIRELEGHCEARWKMRSK
jgi:hypothetical protein